MGTVVRTVLPERRRNYRFALTPLADAMFQLLIFFMLSAGLTPYSLLTLQSTSAAPPSPTAAAGPSDAEVTESASGDVALWTVDANAIVVGGQRFEFDALGDLARALGTPDRAAEVILILRPSARVQDLTSVLAALRAADVSSIQIATGER